MGSFASHARSLVESLPMATMVLCVSQSMRKVKMSKVPANDADVNAACSEGTTALQASAQQGHLEIVQYLVAERGADLNASDYHGKTAATLAASQGHRTVADYLLVRQSQAAAEAEADLLAEAPQTFASKWRRPPQVPRRRCRHHDATSGRLL